MAQVKKAFRKLSVKYHPDKQKTNKEKEAAQIRFVELRAAYDVIGTQQSGQGLVLEAGLGSQGMQGKAST